MDNNILRDRALKRIKALLEKTEENGASIEEAKSALEKATQLMKEYFITINDIEDLKDDPIVTEATQIISIKERTTAFFPIICQLFDLRHFYNKETVTFVGYQTDVKIGIYLYKKIMSGLISDLNDFKKSRKFEVLRMHYHGNTLRRDFISGWIDTINSKVNDLYFERERSFQSENKGGLMLAKKSNVDKKFSEFDVRTITQNVRQTYSDEAFSHGVKQANRFNIQNDLDNGGVKVRELEGI